VGRRGLVWVVVGVLTIAVSGTMPKRAEPTPSHLREAASRSATIKRVRIGGTRYWTVNTVKALRIVDSPYAKAISYVVGVCQSAGAWAFTDGFNGYGAVAYFSTDIRTCFETFGGGPGAPTRQAPCAQFYRTPSSPSRAQRLEVPTGRLRAGPVGALVEVEERRLPVR